MRDARSFRVALISDEFVNPDAGGIDGISVLDAEGWGAIQLPSESYSSEVTSALLANIAEQVEEFLRNDYDVVVIGHHTGLDRALGARGISTVPSARPSSTDDIRAFLRGRPAPSA